MLKVGHQVRVGEFPIALWVRSLTRRRALVRSDPPDMHGNWSLDVVYPRSSFWARRRHVRRVEGGRSRARRSFGVFQFITLDGVASS